MGLILASQLTTPWTTVLPNFLYAYVVMVIFGRFYLSFSDRHSNLTDMHDHPNPVPTYLTDGNRLEIDILSQGRHDLHGLRKQLP
jgi:hypothetical protein